jgi:hypothetical protein
MSSDCDGIGWGKTDFSPRFGFAILFAMDG